jgi:hypothetical protein
MTNVPPGPPGPPGLSGRPTGSRIEVRDLTKRFGTTLAVDERGR